MNKIISIFTHYLFTLIVLGYIFYEEFVWERFAKPIVIYIQSLDILKRLEVYLQKANGTVILIIFVLLYLATEVSGLYGGTLLLRGQIALWILLYAVKIPVAAFTYWLFRVTKPKLMSFVWFEKSFNFIMRWVNWIKATDTYKNIKIKAGEIKAYIKKNYMREGDSTRKKFKRMYTRLKIRFKEVLER